MNRRRLISTAPIAALAAALSAGNVDAAVAMVMSGDPVVALVDEWKRVRAAWEAASAEDDGGNHDTPECLRLETIREEMVVRIQGMTPISVAGIVALMEFAWIDDGADWCGSGDWINVNRAVMENIIAGGKAMNGGTV